MRRLPVIAVSSVCVALAACGEASTPPSPAQSSPSASASPLFTATSSPTATPTATSSGPVACAAGDLQIALHDEGGAAGTVYAQFEIRNSAATDCAISGYPFVAMLTAGHAVIATLNTPAPSPAPVTVILTAGTTALGVANASGHGWLLISWTEVSCSASSASSPSFWSIAPVGAAGAVVVSARDPVSHALPMVCGATVDVRSVQPAPGP